jgi:hypothetical protein
LAPDDWILRTFAACSQVALLGLAPCAACLPIPSSLSRLTLPVGRHRGATHTLLLYEALAVGDAISAVAGALPALALVFSHGRLASFVRDAVVCISAEPLFPALGRDQGVSRRKAFGELDQYDLEAAIRTMRSVPRMAWSFSLRLGCGGISDGEEARPI